MNHQENTCRYLWRWKSIHFCDFTELSNVFPEFYLKDTVIENNIHGFLQWNKAGQSFTKSEYIIRIVTPLKSVG